MVKSGTYEGFGVKKVVEGHLVGELSGHQGHAGRRKKRLLERKVFCALEESGGIAGFFAWFWRNGQRKKRDFCPPDERRCAGFEEHIGKGKGSTTGASKIFACRG